MKRRVSLKFKVITIVAFINISFLIFIYSFDRIVMPTVMVVADAEMRAKALEIINSNVLSYYSQKFNYNDMIKVDKDGEGNIVMLKADTLRMNSIATEVALNSQKNLRELGNVGIEIPMGYIFKNNILANLGPNIKIKMQPIGNVEMKYSSVFESAGINQTRHKIYVDVKTKVKVIIPLKSNDVEVTNQIPICETILLGKVPRTSIDLDLDSIKGEEGE